MIDLPYSLVIESTEESDFFSYFSPNLPGFSGTAHSVEGCIYQARLAMSEHTALLRETDRPVPPPTSDPTILIQNAKSLQRAA